MLKKSRTRCEGISRREAIKLTGPGLLMAGLASTGGGGSVPKASAAGSASTQAGRRSGPGTPREIEADVVVVGGGMAGVCAAIAAARHGSSVVLVQDRPVLGGNASSEVRMHVCGADCSGGRKDTDSRESGIIEEIRLEDAVTNPARCANMYDLLLYDKIRREPNISLLLNTACTGVQTAGSNRIAAVLADRSRTEESFAIRGGQFIDCSGDGRLGAEAGAEFRVGREARREFDEPLAGDTADNRALGSTLLFTTRQYDRPMPFTPPGWIHRFPTCEDLPHRSHGSWEYGYWWVEWGGELDTIRDDERIRDELLSAALGVWDHIKNSGKHPSSENWAIEWLGFLPGKRESRRFIGDHVLSQREVERGEVFEDGVAYGGWPIDLHPPDGIYSREKPAIQIKVPLFNVPLRCLYSRNIANLFFAGRNISATHVAFGSTRIMATCAVMGQAVGTAAALCASRHSVPRELARDGIRQLQQLLLKDDVYMIGVGNSDPADLARRASVVASSETPDGRAVNVVNGVHRGVYQTSNRWVSDPGRPMPQRLELRFETPQRIREIHLVFDTGLSRPLTLTHSDAFNARQKRGPQPETVRDYEIQVLDGASERTVARVTGNYQRKRVHVFKPLTAQGVRVIVHGTNGDPSARVFEVRVYG